MITGIRSEPRAEAKLAGPFTQREIEHLARLINGFGIVGSQIIYGTSSDLYRRASDLILKVRFESEPLLKKIDQMARSSNDEGPLRLIHDLRQLPTDAVQILNLARRCLAASAFLGHCIVVYGRLHGRCFQTCAIFVRFSEWISAAQAAASTAVVGSLCHPAGSLFLFSNH